MSQIHVQATLSLYLMALAGMSLFHGALSDSFGRRRVILVSLVLYTLMLGLNCLGWMFYRHRHALAAET